MGASPNGRKRYSLALPEDLFGELRSVADSRETTVVELLRKFTKLGLLAVQIEETPGAALLIRDRGEEREIVLFERLPTLLPPVKAGEKYRARSRRTNNGPASHVGGVSRR